MTEIQIAQSVTPKNIREIAATLDIQEEKAELYVGLNYKVTARYNTVVLVTEITPTPPGEEETTVSIGLVDALNKLDKKAAVVIREPSLGPVFGIKGGAAGGR